MSGVREVLVKMYEYYVFAMCLCIAVCVLLCLKSSVGVFRHMCAASMSHVCAHDTGVKAMDNYYKLMA